MTEEYISGYLFCISRVKDIYTKYLGGFNGFFGFEKKKTLTTKDNLLDFLKTYINNHLSKGYSYPEIKSEITLTPILNWETSFSKLIEEWTCDKALETLNGKNGYYLSEYLILILKDFFKEQHVLLYKINSDDSPIFWNDMMGEEYLFETEDRFYIMHFGESS